MKPTRWLWSFWIYDCLQRDLLTLDEAIERLQLEVLFRRTGV